MIYFTENEIDRLVEDDVPAGDMTSFLMGYNTQQGRISLYARHPMVVCCTEEAQRIYQKVGLTCTFCVPSGTFLNEGDKLIEATGSANAIHLIWRTGLAMMEFASGIASRTHALVKAAQSINPTIQVAGTRKHPPYLKKIALKALMAGGGIPHRTGLSDTILIFREHLQLLGSDKDLKTTIETIKTKQRERKIVVEAHTISEAKHLTEAGADIIQMDKIAADDFKVCKRECEKINQHICIIAAGGINASNAEAYAKAGAEVLVTSWMYFGQAADIKALIEKI